MSKETQQYIEEMEKMYKSIINKESKSVIELEFLEMYQKTIGEKNE